MIMEDIHVKKAKKLLKASLKRPYLILPDTSLGAQQEEKKSS